MTNKLESCGTCLAFIKDETVINEDIGTCHGEPPKVVIIPNQSALGKITMQPATIFPVVKGNGKGCMMHRLKGE